MKKLNEVFTEYLEYVKNKEVPNIMEEYNHSMKKICRNYGGLSNSHIYHTNIFLMKMAMLNHVMHEVVVTNSGDIVNGNGTRSFLRFTESTVSFPIYTHNGKPGYMLINKNIAATIIPPKDGSGDIKDQKKSNLDPVNNNCQNRGIAVKLVLVDDIGDFDAITFGDAINGGVYTQTRRSIQKSDGCNYVILKYVEFVRLYMNDVVRYVADLVGLPETLIDGHIVRTYQKPGDPGKPVKNESTDIYERSIRQYAKLFNYVKYIDIITSPRNDEEKTKKRFTICRIHL